MDSIKINPETDFFKGQSTILNNKFAALKTAHEFVKNIQNTGRAFIDPEWGPNKDDPKGMKAIVMDPPYSGAPDEDEVNWLHLKEICPGKPPKFVKQNAESSDVLQGYLGDCWLIGALSVVAAHDELLRGDFNPSMDKMKSKITDKEVIFKFLEVLTFRLEE